MQSEPGETAALDGEFTGRCGLLHGWALRRPGIDVSAIVVGNSPELRRLEGEIVKVAQSDWPVMIEGEFGSGKTAAGAAIHCYSARWEAPLVAVRCASEQPETFARNLRRSIDEAQAGSLLLANVDVLDRAMQRDLLAAVTEMPPGAVRLMATCARPLDDLIRQGRFCRLLGDRLATLQLRIPALRSRRSDIRLLVEHEVRTRHRSSKEFSAPALEALEAYAWPENFSELRRCVARLVVMAEGSTIELADLARHTPAIGPAVAPVDGDDPDADEMRSAGELARRLAAGDLSGIADFHPGLQRALTYVSRQFEAEISLNDLAAHAQVSGSHLAYLFKRTVGAPFKAVLGAVRIERAKELLRVRPELRITEVSLEAGFGDLSHFEKTFKRVVGTNPREFRRRWLAGDRG